MSRSFIGSSLFPIVLALAGGLVMEVRISSVAEADVTASGDPLVAIGALPAPVLTAQPSAPLRQLVSAVESAWHKPKSLDDLMVDLVLLVAVLSMLSTACSALANKVPADTKAGRVIHAIALNITATANTARALEAAAISITLPAPVPLPGPGTAVAVLIGLSLLSGVARADVIVPSEKLVNDTQQLNADIKAGATAAQLAADSAAVNADVASVAASIGATAKTGVLAKGWQYELSLGGAGVSNVGFPTSKGASVGGGGGAGVLFDFGFGRSTDSATHYHLSFDVGLNTFTTQVTVPALVVALTPAYQPASNSPLFGFGPVLVCPTQKGSGIRTLCLPGLTFTTGFAAILHSAGIGVE